MSPRFLQPRPRNLAAVLCLGLALRAGSALAGGWSSTNDLPAASFEDLIHYAQRYGNTTEKQAWKAAARDELFRRGPEALRWAVAHAAIENNTIQMLTEELAGRIKAAEAVPVLLEFVNAPEPRVRKTAAYWLGSYPAPGQGARLMPLLQDEEAAGSALRTLGKWRMTNAAPDIIPFLNHTKEVRRVVAANALRDIGDPAAVPALLKTLDDPVFTVRETAARALGSLGTPAQRAMMGALPGAEGRRLRLLIRTLGEFPGRRTRQAVRPFLTHSDPEVRADADAVMKRLQSR
jgi:HEAT repeat protein